MGYVDGSNPCPHQYLSGTTIVAPAYTTWMQQDQLILSWINSSLTHSVLSTISCNQTSRTTWLALELRYASTSQNRILSLRNELLRTMKGDLFISDYLDKMNLVADNFALAGQPIGDDELVQIIRNNLGHAFEMVVSATQARDTPITYPTLGALLLTTERRMVDQVGPVIENPPIVSAFVANRWHGAHRPRGTAHGGTPSGHGSFLNPRGGAARGSFFNQRSNALVG